MAGPLMLAPPDADGPLSPASRSATWLARPCRNRKRRTVGALAPCSANVSAAVTDAVAKVRPRWTRTGPVNVTESGSMLPTGAGQVWTLVGVARLAADAGATVRARAN